MKLPVIESEPNMAALLEGCDRLLQVKGHDYTQGASGAQRLKNFDEAAAELDIPPRKVLAVHLRKQFGAVMTWLKTGEVQSEPIEERFRDIINYVLLANEMRVREQGAKWHVETLADWKKEIREG